MTGNIECMQGVVVGHDEVFAKKTQMYIFSIYVKIWEMRADNSGNAVCAVLILIFVFLLSETICNLGLLSTL